jgi:hypothetical protein
VDERIIVEVEWDREASVWIASSPAIGLFTEAETLDGLRHKVPLIASDLLGSVSGQAGQLRIELLVRLDDTIPAAAA